MAHIQAGDRLEVTTLNLWLRAVTDATVKEWPFLAAIKAKGRVKYLNGKAGKVLEWRVKFRDTTTQTNDELREITPTRTTLHQSASLPWRSLRNLEAVSKYEKLVNQGPAALVDIVGYMLKEQSKSITDRIAKDMFNDGNASGGDGEEIHGLESWFGKTSLLTGVPVAGPSDTYAGLSTALDAYGSGSWSPVSGKAWPTGSGDPQYHFFSPLIIDVTSVELTAASNNTWAKSWQKALRYAITYLRTLHNKRIDVFLLEPEYYRQAVDAMTTDATINVNRGNESLMTKLGFDNITVDGVDVVPCYGIPAGVVGYGVNYDSLELNSLQGQLVATDKDVNFRSQASEVGCDFWGNMRIQTPAWSAKFMAIT